MNVQEFATIKLRYSLDYIEKINKILYNILKIKRGDFE